MRTFAGCRSKTAGFSTMTCERHSPSRGETCILRWMGAAHVSIRCMTARGLAVGAIHGEALSARAGEASPPNSRLRERDSGWSKAS